MARNKLTDLNDHLFLQIEKLSDETLTGERLKEEIDRSKAIAALATPIVNSSKTFVDALKLMNKSGNNIGSKELKGILPLLSDQ